MFTSEWYAARWSTQLGIEKTNAGNRPECRFCRSEVYVVDVHISTLLLVSNIRTQGWNAQLVIRWSKTAYYWQDRVRGRRPGTKFLEGRKCCDKTSAYFLFQMDRSQMKGFTKDATKPKYGHDFWFYSGTRNIPVRLCSAVRKTVQ